MMRGCPGAKDIREVRPEYVACPHCRREIEIWGDEYRARCNDCAVWVYRRQGPTCLDWCQQAEACVGKAALENYRRARDHDNKGAN